MAAAAVVEAAAEAVPQKAAVVAFEAAVGAAALCSSADSPAGFGSEFGSDSDLDWTM